MNEEKPENSQSEDFGVIVPVDQILPEEVFVVPIRYRPLYPGMVSPLIIPEGALADSLARVIENNDYLGLILQKDDSRKGIETDNLYRVGTLGKILKKINLPKGGFHILVNTLSRFTVQEFKSHRIHPTALVEYQRDEFDSKDKELVALTRAVLSNAKEVMAKNPLMTEEMKLTLVNVDEPGKIADFVCSVLSLEKEEFQKILETFDIEKRLEETLHYLARERDILQLQEKIQGQIEDKMANQQREYMLREQLRAIREELGMGSEAREKNAEYYRKRIEETALSGEARERALEEVDKLEYIEPQSNEYGVARNYLDTILDLPWQTPAYRDIDINEAKRILDRDHYGLEDVKERIIEHLSVRIQRKEERGSILCFVGPPGVGKTSLGKSIAAALGKKFFRFSLGGMRDEAEIKGHRRTYIGAMPGKIVQALKVVKEKDPVLMLDEIDKLGASYQGDPASALLEVLDPSQNQEFRDHYLDLPFDLSYISFITTANSLETIPGPLLDRMEVIRLSGYIAQEKVKIAQKYIVPRAIEEMGLAKKDAPKLSAKTLQALVEGYSREAGVRSLEKNIKKIYRKAVAARVQKEKFPANIGEEDLIKVLGKPRFRDRKRVEANFPGTAVGLAWTNFGGSTLVVESAAIPGRGQFKLTGQLGKVMQESADIALTYIRTLTDDPEYWGKKQVHIHVPDGATPKDGPSAGITIASTLLSLYRKKAPRKGYGMTGELRLTGQVLPIGGLKEKVIAARRAGLKHVIFPQDNEGDWAEIPDAVKRGITPHPVAHFNEVMKLLF